ncbi:MAG: helicase [Chloroflexi bacterium]|nr:helicase [Chloroflexota bacterium]
MFASPRNPGGTPAGALAESARPNGLVATVRTSLERFQRGESVAQIADSRGFTTATIEQHLATAIEAGELTRIDDLVLPEKRAAIESAIAEMGNDALLGALRDRLGVDYEYGEIRFVRAAVRAAEQQDSPK